MWKLYCPDLNQGVAITTTFEYEREVRAEIFDLRKSNLQGLNVDVSLDSLIDSVYVSPTAPSWFYEVVKDVLQKYSLDKPTVWSKIKQTPFY